MDSGITIIIGAGAPLDFTFPNDITKPSTMNITDAVRSHYTDYINNSTTDIVECFYQHLRQKYPSTKSCGKTINFEQLLHCMEMYLSYEWSWSDECSNANMCPVFGSFTNPSKVFDVNLLSSVIEKFLIRIMDIVNGYDQYFASQIQNQEQWYSEFFKNLPRRSDIFNFNYDTTIEQIYGQNGYEDGFIDMGNQYKVFSPKQLFENPGRIPTINHLHGCINYYHTYGANDHLGKLRHEDWVKYPSYNEVNNMMIGRAQSQPYSQSGDTLYNGPIITGLNKTAKLNCVPFDFYHGNLQNAIVKNRSLLIIGYGFGDLYCNQLIHRMNLIHGKDTRVCIIDFWDLADNNKFGFRNFANNMNQDLGLTLCYYSDETDFSGAVTNLFPLDKNKVMISQNGKLMLAVNGFKSAAAQSVDIYNFLIS